VGRTLTAVAVSADGSITGNDNDAHPGRYEPHHTVITDPGEVQIYEAIMVNAAGEVTTGLLKGVRFVKDNRVLPTGFDKATAGADIAVKGAAAGDPEFTGGADRVRYGIDATGAPRPLRVRVQLWNQPIAFRWARNLAGFEATETDRFVRYYDAVAEMSGALLAETTRTVEYDVPGPSQSGGSPAW
jgi:hypothetical protein